MCHTKRRGPSTTSRCRRRRPASRRSPHRRLVGSLVLEAPLRSICVPPYCVYGAGGGEEALHECSMWLASTAFLTVICLFVPVRNCPSHKKLDRELCCGGAGAHIKRGERSHSVMSMAESQNPQAEEQIDTDKKSKATAMHRAPLHKVFCFLTLLELGRCLTVSTRSLPCTSKSRIIVHVDNRSVGSERF